MMHQISKNVEDEQVLRIRTSTQGFLSLVDTNLAMHPFIYLRPYGDEDLCDYFCSFLHKFIIPSLLSP